MGFKIPAAIREGKEEYKNSTVPFWQMTHFSLTSQLHILFRSTHPEHSCPGLCLVGSPFSAKVSAQFLLCASPSFQDLYQTVCHLQTSGIGSPGNYPGKIKWQLFSQDIITKTTVKIMHIMIFTIWSFLGAVLRGGGGAEGWSPSESVESPSPFCWCCFSSAADSRRPSLTKFTGGV